MVRNASGRIRGRAAAVATILALGVAACGGDNASQTGGEGEGLAPATFVYAASGVPTGLDVWTTYEGDPSRVNMYEWGSTLVQYDASDLENAGCDELADSTHLRPNLAESWEYSEDDSQLLFTLRDNVKSAAGNVMTAEDVVWSLDSARTQSAVVRFLITSVTKFDEETPFEVVDERTVAVNLAERTSLDVAVFTYPMLGVQDSAAVLANATTDDPYALEWLKTNMANFGPWQLDSFTASTEVVYTRNPNFWDQDSLGNVDQLVIRGVPDAGTRLQLVQTGDVDYAERLAFDQYAELESSGSAKVLSCVSPNRDTLMLNEKFAPFADVNVRRAISAAIDRDALVQGVYSGLANPATYGISEVYWKPSGDAATFAFDPDAATTLLQDAGVDSLSFTLVASPTRPGAYAESLAVQIQSMLANVGVQTSIDVIPGSTDFSDRFFKSNYEAILYLEPPALGDPFYSANLYNSSESFQNTFGYSNPDYDALVKEIQTTEPGEQRDTAIAEASDIVVDTVPQVYLVDLRYLHAFSANISGYENTPHGQLLIYRMTKG